MEYLSNTQIFAHKYLWGIKYIQKTLFNIQLRPYILTDCYICKVIMELTSLDYIRLISWLAAVKHRVILNKTQMQKLLFMCYGQALAMNDRPLFTNETPRAWPFGPVFPLAYKYYEEVMPSNLSEEEKSRFAQNIPILKMITQTIADYCHISATRLSEWSHSKGSPWWRTVFAPDGSAWNREISLELIKSYFQKEEWRIGI